MENNREESVFDRILNSVGDQGVYQTRCNIVFNFLLAAAGTMAYLNIVLAMTVPDHWCYVPGRDLTNFTIDQWRNLTLPRDLKSSGENGYSSCLMYNISGPGDLDDISNMNITTCQYGYEYDKRWFTQTISSYENLVCDDEIKVSNLFAITKAVEVIAGGFIGYIGDTIGRRVVYFISLSLLTFGRLGSLFVVDWYPIFVAVSTIATISSTSVFQSTVVIIMELSNTEDRAFVAQISNLGWTTGLCLLPLIFWIVEDWKYYVLVSTVPLLFYFPLTIFLVESPRWLLSKGRIPECLHQLHKIAKINGTKVSTDCGLILQNTSTNSEKVYGIGSLFSSWRLGKNTFLMLINSMCSQMSYNILLLNIVTLSGNPLINFFIQAIAELPSYIIGRFLSDKLGRRFTGIICYLIGTVGFMSMVFSLHDYSIYSQLMLLALTKFCITVSYFVSSLQGFEIYPTNVRQSGNCLGLLSGNIFSILAPYIVHAGVIKDDRFPFAVLALLGIIGVIAQIFLPETLHEKLPETLHEAKTFGKYQDYWSFPRREKDNIYMMAHLRRLKLETIDESDAEN